MSKILARHAKPVQTGRTAFYFGNDGQDAAYLRQRGRNSILERRIPMRFGLSAKRFIRRLIVNAVPKLSTEAARQISANWSNSNPGQHLLLYEQVHLRKLFSLLDVDCVFDVGANAGQYADMLRTKVGYTGLIISFEPIPEHAQKLRARASSDPLWEIRETALSSKSGLALFSIMASDQFSSLADPHHNETTRFSDSNKPVRRIEINTETLDRVYAELKNLYNFQRPYLKMDTQGFDLEVVRGGSSVLNEFIGLQSELAIVSLYMHAPRMPEAILEYCRLGFGLSALVPNNQGHFPTLMEIDGIFLRNKYLDTLA